MDDNAEKLNDLIDQGLSAYYRESYAESEKLFLKAREIDSANDEVEYQLGSACFYQNRVDEAVEYYKNAVELAPDEPHYLSVLGFALMANNDLQNSVKYLERAVSIDGSDTQALKNLGEAYYLLGEYVKSAESFKALAEIDSQADNLLYHYLSTRKAGMEEEARGIIENANKAIGRDDSLYMVIRLYLGFIDVDMFKSKIGKRLMPCSSLYYCGMRMLFDGKKKEACSLFHESLSTNCYFLSEHRRSQHELESCGG